MPKSRSKPLPPTRLTILAQLRRHKLLSVLPVFIVILGLGISGMHIYNHYAVKADRARFARAEQDVSSLSGAIIASTGQPLKVTNEKFCSRPSVELGDSPLSCNVESLLFYGVEEPSQATTIYHKVSSVVRARWRRTSTNSPGTFVSINTENYASTDSQKIIENYKDTDSKLECTIIYTLYKTSLPPYEEYTLLSEHLFTLGIRNDCSDYAKAQYYPLNNLK